MAINKQALARGPVFYRCLMVKAGRLFYTVSSTPRTLSRPFLSLTLSRSVSTARRSFSRAAVKASFTFSASAFTAIGGRPLARVSSTHFSGTACAFQGIDPGEEDLHAHYVFFQAGELGIDLLLGPIAPGSHRPGWNRRHELVLACISSLCLLHCTPWRSAKTGGACGMSSFPPTWVHPKPKITGRKPS